MELTWGFLTFFILFILPGLIIRRLYYYGEFSKQFGIKEPIIKTLSLAIIPGLINAILVTALYDFFIGTIDFGKVADTYKEISDISLRHAETNGISLRVKFKEYITPYLLFLYLSAFIIGLTNGRIVKILGLDTRFKLFRFNNIWFYLFKGNQLEKLKKYRFLNTTKDQFLFTKADILIDSSSGTQLYSGVIVDYELKDQDNNEVSKIIINKAHRYKKIDGKMNKVAIPGDILIVDCHALKNLNLSYVYSSKPKFIETRFPRVITRFFGLLSIIIIPMFVFQFELITFNWYQEFFDRTFISRTFYYLFIFQIIKSFNPFVENNAKGEFNWITVKVIKIRIVAIALTWSFQWLVNLISEWVSSF